MAIRDPKRLPVDPSEPIDAASPRVSLVFPLLQGKRQVAISLASPEDSQDPTGIPDRPKIIPAKGDLLSLGPPTIYIQGMSLSQALDEQREERF